MTPYLLLCYLAAIAGGIFVIGFAVFALYLLFALVTGWARKPAEPEQAAGPYQTIVPQR